jgi:cyanophycinase
MEPNRGRYYLIGGGPDARTLGGQLMPRLIQEAGGPGARMALITAGTVYPDDTNQCYWEIFESFGLTNIFSPKIFSREDADVAWVAEGIASADAVFIAGGSQAKLEERINGTATEAAMREVYRRGGILSGTSSGASLFGPLMILDGGAYNPHLRPDLIEVGRGFGMMPDTVVDTHCSSRSRFPRMLSLLIANPSLQLIGMDEDSALFIGPDLVAEAVGMNAVYVLDGQGHGRAHGDRPVGDDHLCACGVTLHCLMKGDRYDLTTRTCPG